MWNPLLNGFHFRFADSPYYFKTHGTLCIPTALPLDGQRADAAGEELAYQIKLKPETNLYHCSCQGYVLEFVIPMLRYRFAGEPWTTEAHIDFWHAHFQPILAQKAGCNLKALLEQNEIRFI